MLLFPTKSLIYRVFKKEIYMQDKEESVRYENYCLKDVKYNVE